MGAALPKFAERKRAAISAGFPGYKEKNPRAVNQIAAVLRESKSNSFDSSSNMIDPDPSDTALAEIARLPLRSRVRNSREPDARGDLLRGLCGLFGNVREQR
jgi:hypothetical protein